MNEEIIQDLWEDYLNLCQEYEKRLSIPDFGTAIISFACMMLMDSAKQEGLAQQAIDYAVKNGIRMHEKRKENKE